jgi:ATP-binding cassette subfamily C protein CydD
VALARAFLRVETSGDAPIVLLDEPTAHLDPANAAAVRRAVARLVAGRTAVVVTHDPAWTEAGRHVHLAPATDSAAGDRTAQLEPAR